MFDVRRHWPRYATGGVMTMQPRESSSPPAWAPCGEQPWTEDGTVLVRDCQRFRLLPAVRSLGEQVERLTSENNHLSRELRRLELESDRWKNIGERANEMLEAIREVLGD